MKHSVLLLILFCSVLSAQTDFSQENATGILRTLSVDIGPRPMGSPAEREALKFAVKKFREYGCDTAYIMPMLRSTKVNTTSGIAVGVHRGATKRIILIGGHIDSAGPEIPGADDDGSGSAIVMELARVFGKRPMQSTLVVACFGGEEQGLEGSKYFANNFADLDSVALMLQIDMANGLGTIDADGDTHGASAPSWLVCAAFDEFKKLGYHDLRYPTHFFSLNYAGPAGAGSDHESFLRKGVPSIDFSTDVSKPIHTPQDNFENFDPRGLKRSGDLILKLVDRFDAGIPDKALAQYWLYVVGNIRIFVPYRAIEIFLGISFLLAVFAFVLVRRRRVLPVDIRWSGVKLFLYTFIIVLFAWVSSDIVGWLKGFRYPWMTEIPLYFVLAGLFALLGVWVSLLIAQKLPLTQCPYIFFKRAAIALTIVTILFLLGSVELAIYPASSLFLLSLAVVAKNKYLKIVLALLSPLWMIRLVFNEWGELFYRSLAGAGGMLASFPQNLYYNGGMILFFTLYLYPLVLGLAAMYRDVGGFPTATKIFRSRASGVVLAMFILGFVAYLYPREVYSNLWYRNVFVTYEHSPPGDTSGVVAYVSLRSAEYLDEIRITGGGRDTVLSGHLVEARFPIGLWAAFGKNLGFGYLPEYRENQKRNGDTTNFTIDSRLQFSQRPYIVTMTYSSKGTAFKNFSSSWLYTTDGNQKMLRWYSFPDAALRIPIQFQIVGNDSVKEYIDVVYNDFPLTWNFEREKTNFILRAKYQMSTVYKPAGDLPRRP